MDIDDSIEVDNIEICNAHIFQAKYFFYSWCGLLPLPTVPIAILKKLTVLKRVSLDGRGVVVLFGAENNSLFELL